MTHYTSMSEFVIAVERAWKPYRDYISSLTPEQLDGPSDAAGWTVKDHIAHVTSWQEGITAVLQGRPRHEGMGLSKADRVSEVETDDEVDALNAKMRDIDAHFSGEEAVEEAILKHEGFVMELESQPEEAVSRKRSDYLPGPDPDDMSFTDWVWNNSGAHYAEHLTYIRRILGEDVPDPE